MKPDEFTHALRERIRQDMGPYMDAVIQNMGAKDSVTGSKLLRFLEDPGGVFAKEGLIDKESVAKVNDLAMAIYKSGTINDYMKKATESFKGDEKLVATFERLVANPDQVKEEELTQALQKILEDDRFVTGPMKVLLEDKGVRLALGLGDDVTFENYIQRVRKAIKDAKTLEEITKEAQLFPGDKALTAVATVVTVGVAVVVTVAAVVHTAAVAVNYVGALTVLTTAVVFTVAGQNENVLARRHGIIPVDDDSPESNCINETESTLWVVVRGELGFKRVPLPPCKSTIGMGLTSIEAILIGGKFNALQTLSTERDGLQDEGAYMLYKNVESPGVVCIRKGTKGFEAVVNTSQSQAEASGQAGYSDLSGRGSAGHHFDQRFRMREVAAAVPEGLDFMGMVNNALDADHFYRTLRIATMARAIKEGLSDA